MIGKVIVCLSSLNRKGQWMVCPVSSEEWWGAFIFTYMVDGILPTKWEDARQVCMRSSRDVLRQDILYKKSFAFPLLRCLHNEEGTYVLQEIHEGMCGNHSRYRALSHKALRAGYFQPTMMCDAKEVVQTSDDC